MSFRNFTVSSARCCRSASVKSEGLSNSKPMSSRFRDLWSYNVLPSVNIGSGKRIYGLLQDCSISNTFAKPGESKQEAGEFLRNVTNFCQTRVWPLWMRPHVTKLNKWSINVWSKPWCAMVIIIIMVIVQAVWRLYISSDRIKFDMLIFGTRT